MEKNPTPPNATRQAIMKCAGFLDECLRIGWKKSSLDFLQNLWWKYHDHEGNLVSESV